MNRFWRTATEVDRRLSLAGCEYCIIKSYGGSMDYTDHNIDIVVDASLLEVYRKAFSDEFTIHRRDLTKYRFYERNKLMLSPKTSDSVHVHLHKNAGWHNICFVSADRILSTATRHRLNGKSVRIADRDLEARIFIYHVIFEQFRNTERDMQFLTTRDYTAFAETFELDTQQVSKVSNTAGMIPLRDLRPIWHQVYSSGRLDGSVMAWNRFLHWGYLCVRRFRAVKSSFRNLLDS